MTASVIYKGDLHCDCTHIQSGSVIETDAPTDNKGKGENFSPTDLLCISFATCLVTTMGIKAADMNINIEGTTLEVTKHMLSEPRRVGKIDLVINFPQIEISQKDKIILQRVGDNCPVFYCLHPDVEKNIIYKWL